MDQPSSCRTAWHIPSELTTLKTCIISESTERKCPLQGSHFWCSCSEKILLITEGLGSWASAPLFPCVPCIGELICVTCLSELNPALNSSPFAPCAQWIKKHAGKNAGAIDQDFYLIPGKQQRWSLLHMEVHREKRRKDRQTWKSASAIKSAAAALNLMGPHSTECTTMFLQPRTWAPSNALRHKVTNVCRVLCIFSLTPTPTHTCTDCVTSEKTKPVKAGCLKAE